jgi:hypothetical protein
MGHFIKSLTATGRVSTDLVSAALIVIGGLLAFGAGVYGAFVQPEWTLEHALQTLWPYFVAGIACLTLGWLVDRSQS